MLLEEMMELLFATVQTKCWLGKGQTSGRGGRNTRHWEVPLPWAAEGPALQTNLAKTKVLPFPLIQTWIPCYVFLNLHVVPTDYFNIQIRRGGSVSSQSEKASKNSEVLCGKFRVPENHRQV